MSSKLIYAKKYTDSLEEREILAALDEGNEPTEAQHEAAAISTQKLLEKTITV